MNETLDLIMEELNILLGPDSKEKEIYIWCNADWRPDGLPCPTLEDLMK